MIPVPDPTSSLTQSCIQAVKSSRDMSPTLLPITARNRLLGLLDHHRIGTGSKRFRNSPHLHPSEPMMVQISESILTESLPSLSAPVPDPLPLSSQPISSSGPIPSLVVLPLSPLCAASNIPGSPSESVSIGGTGLEMLLAPPNTSSHLTLLDDQVSSVSIPDNLAGSCLSTTQNLPTSDSIGQATTSLSRSHRHQPHKLTDSACLNKSTKSVEPGSFRAINTQTVPPIVDSIKPSSNPAPKSESSRRSLIQLAPRPPILRLRIAPSTLPTPTSTTTPKPTPLHVSRSILTEPAPCFGPVRSTPARGPTPSVETPPRRSQRKRRPARTPESGSQAQRSMSALALGEGKNLSKLCSSLPADACQSSLVPGPNKRRRSKPRRVISKALSGASSLRSLCCVPPSLTIAPPVELRESAASKGFDLEGADISLGYSSG